MSTGATIRTSFERCLTPSSSISRRSASARRVVRADAAGAVAVRTGLGGRLDHAGAQALARHLEEAEGGDAADLDAGAVGLELVLELLLDGGVVAPVLHVDEVDDDEAGEVAEPHLPGGFLGGFHVGLEGGLLDRGLARGAAGVDVDGDQRLGDVDDDVAAGLELHDRVEHRREVALDLEAREERQGVGVMLHVLRVRRHEHLHVVLGLAVAALAVDEDLVHLAAVEVADGALDQAALLVDRGGGDRLQREVADHLPLAQQVFVVALDLGLGARGAGGADDEARAVLHRDRG